MRGAMRDSGAEEEGNQKGREVERVCASAHKKQRHTHKHIPAQEVVERGMLTPEWSLPNKQPVSYSHTN